MAEIVSTSRCYVRIMAYIMPPVEEFLPLARARPHRGEGGRPFAPTRSTSVWHYTNAAGLLGIVTGRELWASSPIALNDSAEVEYGISIFTEVWRNFDKSGLSPEVVKLASYFLDGEAVLLRVREFVILSASKEPDLLNQWQGYSTGTGYAIELATHWPLAVVVPDSFEGGVPPRGGWFDVIYDVRSQARIAQKVIAHCLTYIAPSKSGEIGVYPMFSHLIAMTSARFKHPAFLAEKEVRFIQPQFPDVVSNFRLARDRIVPFMRLRRSDNPFALESSVRSSLPIVAVMIGPADAWRTRVMQTTATELSLSNGIIPRIETSKVPYRSA